MRGGTRGTSGGRHGGLGFGLGLAGRPVTARASAGVATASAPAASAGSPSSTSSATLAWPGERVRKEFVDYFVEKQEHASIASSPVVPLNDPTLMFANSGMNQFKAIFMGQLEPSSPLQGVKRAANSQKCIRAGGKHNDLDDVGWDTYHHTFFEMLGNWSFGDYFKEEAIGYAWEVLTKVYGMDPERLYASYFAGDEALGLPADVEAKELWERYLPPSRILPFDKSDNFWEMGAVGPCGPCSELHYDRIGGRDAALLVNADDPDVIEIWNLVFMQFYRDDAGSLSELPNRHIDTGMGMERVTSILQDVRSNYDTDIFAPLLAAVHKQVGGEPYRGRLGDVDVGLRDTAYRVIVDHARTLTFAVADGAIPSSEGRGYVLRRILRRAVRYGRQKLDAPPGFFSQLVTTVIESMSSAYPELSANAERVRRVLREEEVAFDRTVARGCEYFEELRGEMAKTGTTVVPGDRAFLLYDTHGFPIDITEQMASEAGLTVDLAGFDTAMARQKERSREAYRELQAYEQGMKPLELVAEQTAWLATHGVVETDDAAKYASNAATPAKVKAIFGEKGFVNATSEMRVESDAGTAVGVVLDRTSFYAESGGQVADAGVLRKTDGSVALALRSVQVFGGYVLHCGLLPPGAVGFSVGDELMCEVDSDRRSCVAPNHTMTHVLNWALRSVLGDGVEQRGSLVNDERLRFDFSADAVSVEQLAQVEKLVQRAVEASYLVTTAELPLATALSIAGLRAMAGEAYPDPVRVVTVGPATLDEILADPSNAQWRSQSVEFCGGTHISTTAAASDFVLLEEKAISKGVRRIVAATGAVARQARSEAAQVGEQLSGLERNEATDEAEVLELSKRVDTATLSAAFKVACRERLEALRKKLKKTQQGVAKEAIKAAKAKLDEAVAVATTHCVVNLEGLDAKALQQAVQGADAGEVAVLAMAATPDGTVHCIATLPEGRQADFSATAWVQAALAPLGGRAGGKPGRAQGSAAAAGDRVAEALSAAEAYWA